MDMCIVLTDYGYAETDKYLSGNNAWLATPPHHS